MEKIKQLQQIIDTSNRIVFFGGAGVSTESGIPDFRSADGLYHQKYKGKWAKLISFCRRKKWQLKNIPTKVYHP